jgi:WD40 repeat protein
MPDGRRLITSGLIDDPFMQAWDLADGSLVAQRRAEGGHGGEDFAFTPEGDAFAWGGCGGDQRILVLATSLDREIARRTSPEGRRLDLALGRAGRYLLQASPGGLRAWDLARPAVHAVLSGHESYAYDAAFDPRGRVVASVGWDGTLRTWDRETRKPLRVVREGVQPHPTSVAWSHDGTRLVTCGDFAIALFDADSGRPVARRGIPSAECELDVHPERDVVLAALRETVLVVELGTLETLASIEGRLSACWSPDGRRLVVARPEGSTIVALEAASLQEVWSAPVGARVLDLAWSAVSGGVAVAGDDGLRVVDGATGQPRFEGPPQKVLSVAWSADGRRIVTGGFDGSLRFRDAESGDLVAELRPHEEYVKSVAFSPDGHVLVTASGDGDVQLLDATPRHAAEGGERAGRGSRR